SARARAPKPESCWHRSTAGSPRALIPSTCRKPRRCSTNWHNMVRYCHEPVHTLPNGYLAPGVHAATLSEVVERFGTNTPRHQVLASRLRGGHATIYLGAKGVGT